MFIRADRALGEHGRAGGAHCAAQGNAGARSLANCQFELQAPAGRRVDAGTRQPAASRPREHTRRASTPTPWRRGRTSVSQPFGRDPVDDDVPVAERAAAYSELAAKLVHGGNTRHRLHHAKRVITQVAVEAVDLCTTQPDFRRHALVGPIRGEAFDGDELVEGRCRQRAPASRVL